MKSTTIRESVFWFWMLIIIIGCVGWIRNIVIIADSQLEHLTGMLVLRIIGVFIAPLGAILGLF